MASGGYRKTNTNFEQYVRPKGLKEGQETNGDKLNGWVGIYRDRPEDP